MYARILSLFSMFSKMFRFLGFGPGTLGSWEPESEKPYRVRLGFIDTRKEEDRTRFSDELVRSKRELLFERIRDTTNGVPVDLCIRPQAHRGAMEFRARWDGRGWRNPPPVVDRAEIWTEGVTPDADFEINRERARCKPAVFPEDT